MCIRVRVNQLRPEISDKFTRLNIGHKNHIAIRLSELRCLYAYIYTLQIHTHKYTGIYLFMQAYTNTHARKQHG